LTQLKARSNGKVERDFPSDDELLAAFERAGRDAVIRHKKLGFPVYFWRDGKVVEVPPEEIPEDGVFRSEEQA